MKKVILLAFATAFSFAAMAQKADDVIKMNTEKHDFGKVKHNSPVTYYFEITNTSDKPIVIENASASCGCTVPEKPTQPILPGKSDKLKIVYSANAIGPINKEVYIKVAGIADQKIVRITGEVLSAEAYAALPSKRN